MLLLYAVVVAGIWKHLRKIDKHTVREWKVLARVFVKSCTSRRWFEEAHSVQRLLKHFNTGAAIGIGGACVLIVYYVTLSAVVEDHYNCRLRSVTATSLTTSLFSWTSTLDQSETVSQRLFILLAFAFCVYCVWFWGAQSTFAKDRHPIRAAIVYNGLQNMSHLLQCVMI